MVTEDYVSFETAKLLKEKGFDECCPVKYKYVKEFDKYLQTTEYVDDNFKKYYYLCPTIQMAMKWLRKNHNIHCDIGYDDCDWFWNIISVDKNVPAEDRPLFIKDGLAGYKSYEEACKAAIKYCLENLI